MRSDSSLNAAGGGYGLEAAFWWYLEWPLPIQTRTLRYGKLRHDPSLISINSLKYAAQLITMLDCHLHHLDTQTSQSDAHPIYLLECNNTAGESWLNKGCTSSAAGRDLARLQAALLLHHGAGYHFGHVDTKSNVIADGISWIPSESSLSNNFLILLTQAPSLLGCRRFLPNADIVSLIVDVLLQTASWDPLTVSRQLLTDPGRFISYPGATT